METNFNRRNFLKNTATAGLALSILPSNVMGGVGRVSPAFRKTF